MRAVSMIHGCIGNDRTSRQPLTSSNLRWWSRQIYTKVCMNLQSFWDCLFKSQGKKKRRSKLSFMDKTRNLVFSFRLRMSEMYRYCLKVRGMSSWTYSDHLMCVSRVMRKFSHSFRNYWWQSGASSTGSGRTGWFGADSLVKGNGRPLLLAAIRRRRIVITQ